MSVFLNVVRFEQAPGLCGAATAQMILHYKNLIGNQVADQNTLWKNIKANTAGSRPKPPAKIAAHDCPKFDKQKCDRCPGATKHQCWCTFPPALHATLLYYNLPFAMVIAPNDQAATASVMASVGFDIPAAALVQAGLHWIAVIGYETGGAGAQMIGGQAVSAIYVRDPEVGAANHDVDIDTWLSEYVSPVVQCGGFFSQLVVISATAPAAVAVQTTTPTTPTTAVVTVGKKPKKPRKPGRPPLNRPPRPPTNPRATRQRRKR